MAEQYIYTIENLTKAYGKREVLKNIWLAFYPGAKNRGEAMKAVRDISWERETISCMSRY